MFFLLLQKTAAAVEKLAFFIWDNLLGDADF